YRLPPDVDDERLLRFGTDVRLQGRLVVGERAGEAIDAVAAVDARDRHLILAGGKQAGGGAAAEEGEGAVLRVDPRAATGGRDVGQIRRRERHDHVLAGADLDRLTIIEQPAFHLRPGRADLLRPRATAAGE